MASTRTASSVAIVRIATGVIFFAEGFSKITGEFVRGGFAGSAREMAAGKAWPFWSHFLRAVVIPNASGFGWFFALAELALGVALILGLLTRAAAIGGRLPMGILLLGQAGRHTAAWATCVPQGRPPTYEWRPVGRRVCSDAVRQCHGHSYNTGLWFSQSVDTPAMRSPAPRLRSWRRERLGNSSRHGTHHVAQKLTRTTWPLSRATASRSPAASISPASREGA